MAHQRTKGAPFAAIQPVRQYAEHTVSTAQTHVAKKHKPGGDPAAAVL